MKLLLVPALALLAPLFVSLAGGTLPGVQECRDCRGRGLLPCPAHKDVVKGQGIDPSRRATFCNAAVDCETCTGLEWLDCSACEDAEAEAWLKGRADGLVEAGKRAAKYEKFMERPLHLAESDHFLLVCELKPRKAGRSKANTHQLLHIYLDRLETLFDDYCALLGAKDEEFARRSLVFLWEEREDHEKGGKEYCEWEWEEPFLFMRGGEHKLSIHGGDKRYRNDVDLHRTVVHHVAHGLMNLQKPSLWTGDAPGGWADVGIAHWFEDKYFGLCDVFCNPQTAEGKVFAAKKWRPGVRKLVDGDQLPSLEDFSNQTARQLDGESHALGFALIDYLAARDPAKLNLMLKRLRSRTPLRDSVKEIFGEKVEEFQDAFEAWVRETYPKR